MFDIYHNFIKYDENVVYIAFHKNTMEPYFHANQVCKMLGYKDIKDALRTNVDKNYISRLKDIVENYKLLYKNVQGTTKFLSEAGLYSLIFKSRLKNANELTKWIATDVMPTIRKRGEFKMNHKYKKTLDFLNSELESVRSELIKKEK